MERMLVDVSDLSRSFGRKLALDRVNFHVAKGRVCGLVGANGAGKTTLIKHLLGLLRAQSGSVRLFDHDPGARSRGGAESDRLPLRGTRAAKFGSEVSMRVWPQ